MINQNLSATDSSISPKHGVVTLFGYGVQVRVDRGHLMLDDGIAAERRHARLPRVGHGLERLVVIGTDGIVSLAAIQWLTEQNAAFVMVDREGKVLTTAGPSRKPDARIRRAQGLALQSGVGLQIARELINQKLIGQENVARNSLRSTTVADAIAGFRAELGSAVGFDQIRLLEAQAGSAYWSAWKTLTVTFPTKDAQRVPAHWQTFQSRMSLLSRKSARKATDPCNAMLNYLYAVLESEARLAASALGLDPGLGFLHSDMANRDSLALDLMEPVRPLVDAYVLEWIFRDVLKRDWFFEERDGNCRLMADLASRLSETAPAWRKALAPIAEFVTRSLWSTLKQSTHERGPGTHLTQQNRREANNSKFSRAFPKLAKPQSMCRTCGVRVAVGAKYCSACGAVRCAEKLRERTPEKEAKRRARSNSTEAQANRAAASRRNALAQWHWDPSTQPAWLTQEFYV